jgi:IclR family acetate operon transcriptional repressor
MRNINDAPPALDSVDRALQLLVTLRDGAVLSVKTAAAQLDVAPSTAHRLLSTLVSRGFAVQDRDRTYRAGPELVQRSDAAFSLNALRQSARASLEQLHTDIEDTVQLMVLNGSNIRFVDGIESEGVLKVAARIGDQMPAYCSAGGKAILAELGNPIIEQLHRGGIPAWPTARISTLSGLKRQLAAVRKAGYGTNIEETEQGVSGLGVCIRNDQGQPVAAFTVAIPSARFKKESIEFYVKALQAAAASTERALAAQ